MGTVLKRLLAFGGGVSLASVDLFSATSRSIALLLFGGLLFERVPASNSQAPVVGVPVPGPPTASPCQVSLSSAGRSARFVDGIEALIAASSPHPFHPVIAGHDGPQAHLAAIKRQGLAGRSWWPQAPGRYRSRAGGRGLRGGGNGGAPVATALAFLALRWSGPRWQWRKPRIAFVPSTSWFTAPWPMAMAACTFSSASCTSSLSVPANVAIAPVAAGIRPISLCGAADVFNLASRSDRLNADVSPSLDRIVGSSTRAPARWNSSDPRPAGNARCASALASRSCVRRADRRVRNLHHLLPNASTSLVGSFTPVLNCSSVMSPAFNDVEFVRARRYFRIRL